VWWRGQESLLEQQALAHRPSIARSDLEGRSAMSAGDLAGTTGKARLRLPRPRDAKIAQGHDVNDRSIDPKGRLDGSSCNDSAQNNG